MTENRMLGAIKKIGLRWFNQEIDRYGKTDGLRTQLLPLVSEAGSLITSLPMDVIERTVSFGDTEAFNGSLRRFGLSDQAIRGCQDVEESFLKLITSRTSWRPGTFRVCTDYHRCAHGLNLTTGPEELVTLFRINPAIRGSHYEGWAESTLKAGERDSCVRDTLAYSTIPYPPPLGVVIRNHTCSNPFTGPMRVRIGDRATLTQWLDNLVVISLLGFDNEAMLFFAPQNPVSGEVCTLAFNCGMTAL